MEYACSVSEEEIGEPVSARTRDAERPDYGRPDPETGLEPHDLELIRWMLGLTPVERLRYVQRFVSGIRRLELARRS